MMILGKFMEKKSNYPVHGGHGTADGERSIFHDEYVHLFTTMYYSI